MEKKFKVVVWYPPKKKFIALEKGLNRRDAMRRAYFFKGKMLPFIIKKNKLKKVM